MTFTMLRRRPVVEKVGNVDDFVCQKMKITVQQSFHGMIKLSSNYQFTSTWYNFNTILCKTHV